MTRNERLTLAASRYGKQAEYIERQVHAYGLDLDVVERAAKAWVGAARFVGKAGRGGAFRGKSAHRIIEEVATFAGNRELYHAYERTVRRVAYALTGRRKTRNLKRLTPTEKQDIIAMIRAGLNNPEISKRSGRSQPVISKLRRVA